MQSNEHMGLQSADTLKKCLFIIDKIKLYNNDLKLTFRFPEKLECAENFILNIY